MSKLEKAEQANRLLNDQGFIQACKRVEGAIVSRWSGKGLTVEEREELYQRMQALQAVKIALATEVADGKMEAAANEAKARAAAITKGK